MPGEFIGGGPEIVETKKYPYEAIVVMPYSSGKYVRGRKYKTDKDFGLTYESKLSCLAAAQAYIEGKAGKIMLTGESTVGAPKYSTADFMKEFLVFKGVPESDIYVNRDLQNSAEQLERVSEMQNPNDKFLIVSLGFHQPRVKVISNSKGINADHEVAEELLQRRNSTYTKVTTNWNASKGIKKARKLEAILTPLSRFKLASKLLNVVTAIRGTRKPLTTGDFPRRHKRTPSRKS